MFRELAISVQDINNIPPQEGMQSRLPVVGVIRRGHWDELTRRCKATKMVFGGTENQTQFGYYKIIRSNLRAEDIQLVMSWLLMALAWPAMLPVSTRPLAINISSHLVYLHAR